MHTIPIVFAFDKRFLMPACVCITSLLDNAAEDTFYDIFILHTEGEELSSSDLLTFEKYPHHSITYIPVSKFSGAYEIRGITKLTYYRLLIPELIPQYDKILYSDVDVVFRSDLSQYYDFDMGESYIAGVNTLFHFFPKYGDYYRRLGLDCSKLIYAGNILINSHKIRTEGIVSKFVELAKHNFEYQDMDVINIACQGHISYLPPSFCLTTFLTDTIAINPEVLDTIWSQNEIRQAISNGIVHYNGQKPWVDICPNIDVWWEYYRRSKCFDMVFHYDFWNSRIDLLEKLSLFKRIKVLIRFFVFGRK